MKRVLLLNGHPREGSLCDGIADAYEQGLKEAGHTYKRTNLRDLEFDLNITNENMKAELEKDLQQAQKDIEWCTHLVLVTPVWWMSVPALTKGFFDRTLLPGWAYKYRKNSIIPFPIPFLKGRSVRVLYTQGGPTWISRFLVLDAFWRALKYATFMFCGFGPVRRTVFPYVAKSTDKKREAWIAKAKKLGKIAA